MRTISALIFFALLLGGHSELYSQIGFGSSAEQVSVETYLSLDNVHPGSEFYAALQLDIAEQWHINAHIPTYDYLIGTELTLEEVEGIEILGIDYPEPVQYQFAFADDILDVYEGTEYIFLRIGVARDLEPGQYTLNGTLRVQACDDQVCLPPSDKEVRFHLPVAEDSVPSNKIHQEIFPDDLLDRTETEKSEKLEVAPEEAREIARPTFFGITLPSPEGLLGLVVLAMFSAMGGFVLNLTPCVLPIIPIKIMTVLEHANRPGKNVVLGLWMATGVIAFWVAIGLPVAFFAGATDPSQVFGIWWVTFGIGALIALMGVGIMGLFTIQLPQVVYAVNPKADTAWGSFVFGVMTAVLGLPCFGFVAGALLAGAATLPPVTIMVIFTSLGIGMALPYLVLSINPKLVEKVPRTGPASELVKQVMGLLLLAAAAYFIGAGLIALVAEHPYVAQQLHWWAVAIFVGIAALWLIIRTFQISSSAWLRFTFTIAGLLVATTATLYAMSSTNSARTNWEVRQAASTEAGGAGYVTGYWNEWRAETVEQARQDGHIVVLDFTATWCINCHALKQAVLDRDPVRSELASPDIVKFTVDLTARSAPGWNYLREELGQTGIPLLAIYGPDDDDPWMSNAYTSQQVLNAIEEARERRAGFARLVEPRR